MSVRAAMGHLDRRPVRLGRTRTEFPAADLFEAGRTEAFPKAVGNPVELPVRQRDSTAPAAILAALKPLLAVLTEFFGQNSTPFCALMPLRNGCLIIFISETRSARSRRGGFTPRPVMTTCCRGGR